MLTDTRSHLVTGPETGLLRRASLGLAAWRQRRALARLDAHALDDIGLTRRQAEAEAARPVWDVPAHWLK